jgi:hypothetical protein
MTLFEYITVAVSLVLSLGLVRLLEGGLSAFSRSRVYPIHALWVIVVFTQHFMYWWMLWGVRGVVDWNFPRFLFLALPAVVLYLQATVLVSSTPRAVSSWREHYYLNAPLFFGLNIVRLLLSVVVGWVAENSPPSSSTLAITSVTALASIAAMFSRTPWIHGAVVTVAVGINFLVILTISFSPLPAD